MYYAINNLGIEGISMHRLLNLIPSSTQQKAYQIKSVSKGDYIYHPFKNGHNVYLIQKGQVKASVMNQTGKEHIQYIAEKGELFGDWNLLHQHQFGEFAQAMQTTDYYEIPLEKMQKLIEQNRMAQLLFLQMIRLRYEKTEARLSAQLTTDARNRVLNLLQELVKEKGIQVGEHTVVEPFFSQSEIAALVGCSAQSVGLTLRDLKSKGIIDFTKKRLRINKNLETSRRIFTCFI